MSAQSPITLRFDKLPSMMAAYAKALNPKKRTDPAAPWPQLRAIIDSIYISRPNLEAYCKLCALPYQAQLPAVYPHLLAAPLHAQLLSHPSLPIALPGLIHARNTIDSFAPISWMDRLHIEVELGERRAVKRGVEFDLITKVSRDGALVWRQLTTILANVKAAGPTLRSSAPPSTAQPHIPTPHTSTSWSLDADMGRRYARVCGDFNPIHLTRATARVSGFKRPIIHGMWTLSRALSDLQDHIPPQPWRLEVEFKRPIYLPSRVIHQAWSEDAGQTHTLEIRSPDQGTLHVHGLLHPLEREGA